MTGDLSTQERRGRADGPRHAPGSRLELLSRRTIAVGAANFGFVAILTRFQTAVPLWADVAVFGLAFLAFAAAVLFFVSRRGMEGVGARAFGIFADVGTLGVLLTLPPDDAGVGCILFAVTGAFILFYLPRRWLIAHHVFAAIATIGFAAAAIADGSGAVQAVARADVVLAAVIGTSLTTQLAWEALRRRAHLAGLDPLTGVRNLRGMWRDAMPMLDRSEVNGDVVAVAVADIDGFKSVNDEFGHDVGDLVLVDVARSLADHIGGQGFVARSGGEEFTVVVCGPIGAVRDVVASIPTQFCGVDNSPTVTMSIGVALAESRDAVTGHDAARLAQRQADHVMYEVKRSGGNGVAVDF